MYFVKLLYPERKKETVKKEIVGEDGKTYVVKEKKPFYKRIWLWIVIILIIGLFIGLLVDRPDSDIAVPSTSESSEISEESSEAPTNLTVEEQYQAIFNDYTSKIKEAAPKLADEYTEEAATSEDLVELSNTKIAVLADLSTEGVSKMADLHFKSGIGTYEDYQNWSDKLLDVYLNEAIIITEAYMSSVQ